MFEKVQQKHFQSDATCMGKWNFLAGTDIVSWRLVSVNLRLQSLCTYSTSSEYLKF